MFSSRFAVFLMILFLTYCARCVLAWCNSLILSVARVNQKSSVKEIHEPREDQNEFSEVHALAKENYLKFNVQNIRTFTISVAFYELCMLTQVFIKSLIESTHNRIDFSIKLKAVVVN